MPETVALIKSDNYGNAETAVRKAVELLGGIDRFVRPGMRILIKPNLLFGLAPERCVTTHPEVVKAVVKLVKEAGAVPVMGDSPVMGPGSFHAKKAGFRDICRDFHVEWVDFENDSAEVPGLKAFKKLTIARIAAEADAIINLPKLKTHGQAYMTVAVKNMFGIVPGVRKAQWHLAAGKDAVKFGEMLAEVCYVRKPVLNIVDGIMAMDGNGPRNGNPFPLGCIAAGGDSAAVDETIFGILKLHPSKVATHTAAANLKLGVTDAAEIELLGDDPERFDARNFRFGGQALLSDMGKFNFLVPYVRNGVTSRPVVSHSVCTQCRQCIDHCPAKAMELSPDKKISAGKVTIDLNKCVRCYCCSEVCPEGAISVGQGWMWKFAPGILK